MSVFVLKNAFPNLQVVFRNQIMRNRFSKWPTQPPVLVGSGGKAAGGEADHSPQCISEVKNEWSYSSMAWTGT